MKEKFKLVRHTVLNALASVFFLIVSLGGDCFSNQTLSEELSNIEKIVFFAGENKYRIDFKQKTLEIDGEKIIIPVTQKGVVTIDGNEYRYVSKPSEAERHLFSVSLPVGIKAPSVITIDSIIQSPGAAVSYTRGQTLLLDEGQVQFLLISKEGKTLGTYDIEFKDSKILRSMQILYDEVVYDVIFEKNKAEVFLEKGTELDRQLRILNIDAETDAILDRKRDQDYLLENGNFHIRVGSEDNQDVALYTVLFNTELFDGAGIQELLLTYENKDYPIEFGGSTEREVLLDPTIALNQEATITTLVLDDGSTSDKLQGERYQISEDGFAIRVTSQDKQTQARYVVRFSVKPYTGTSISMLVLRYNGQPYTVDFGQGTGAQVTLPPNTSTRFPLVVEDYTLDPGASATGLVKGSRYSLNNEGDFSFSVTSSSLLQITSYIVRFTVELSTGSGIQTLVVSYDGGEFINVDFRGTEASITLPKAVRRDQQVKIVSLQLDENANSIILEGSIHPIGVDRKLQIPVSSQDGQNNSIYTVSFEYTPYSGAHIINMTLFYQSRFLKTFKNLNSFQDQNVTINLPRGVKLGGEIQIQSGVELSLEASIMPMPTTLVTVTDDGTGQGEFVVTVTPEDMSTTVEYTFTLVSNLFSGNDLIEMSLSVGGIEYDGDIQEDMMQPNINFTLGRGTKLRGGDVRKLELSPGAEATVDDQLIRFGSQIQDLEGKTLVVTSQSGVEKSYTLRYFVRDPAFSAYTNYNASNTGPSVSYIGQGIMDDAMDNDYNVITIKHVAPLLQIFVNIGSSKQSITSLQEGIAYIKKSHFNNSKLSDGENITVTLDGDTFIAAVYHQYQIFHWLDLQAIRKDLSGHYTLMKAINIPNPGDDGLSPSGFTPIGRQLVPFTGSFGSESGRKFRIHNLFINQEVTSYVGLFGSIKKSGGDRNPVISDFELSIANINGNGVLGSHDVGGVAGEATNVVFSNITVLGGFIQSKHTTSGHVAGIVGRSESCEFRGCTVSLNTVEGVRYVGGIAGFARGGEIRDCVVENVNVKGERYHAGGLVGGVESITIIRSRSSADVEGIGYVGGLAGSVSYAPTGKYSTIMECYTTSEATVTVKAEGTTIGDNVGGLIGYVEDTKLSTSFSLAVVSGGNNVGGLVGKLVSQRPGIGSEITEVVDCYYSGSSVRGNKNVGGLVGSMESAAAGKVILARCYVTGAVNARNSGIVSTINRVLGYRKSENSRINICYFPAGDGGIGDGYVDNIGIDVTTFLTNPGDGSKANPPFQGWTFGSMGTWRFRMGDWPLLNNVLGQNP